MNLGEMRLLLQRALNDTGGDIWSPTESNALLNLGLIDIQSFVEAAEPDAFVYVDKRTIEAGERWYAKPVGMTSERELNYSSNPGSVDHSKLPLASYEAIRRGEVPEPSYAHMGRYFYLSWLPAAEIVDGLELVYHPTLAMAEDTDVPDVHLRLHYAIVMAAAIKATVETPDDSKKFQDLLAIELRKIPTLYMKSAADNLEIPVDMGPFRTNY